MNNDNERICARRIYDEEARLRSFCQNHDALLELFDPVSRIDCDLLGAALVAEYWVKSFVKNDRVVYRRPIEEDDLTELVLPCVKDEFYEAQILAAGARYAEFNHTSIIDALKRWTEETRNMQRNVSTPNSSSFLKEPDYFGSAYDDVKEARDATVAALG